MTDPHRKVRGETEIPTKTAIVKITPGGGVVISGIIKNRGMEGGNKVVGAVRGIVDAGRGVGCQAGVHQVQGQGVRLVLTCPWPCPCP